MKKYTKPILAILVLLIAAGVFITYFNHHPEVRHQLSRLSTGEILQLLLLYLLSIVAIAIVNAATLKVCSIRAVHSETMLITAYSAVANFFGPLQSGPAARAIYLKKRYRVDLKKYGLATLLYYFFWAFFSGVLLLSGIFKWYLVPLVILGLIAVYVSLKSRPIKTKYAGLKLEYWYLIALATLMQIAIVSLIYFIEIHTVAPHASYSQAAIYTGAANFALFVSITPGAIGFREAFLVFSNRLHHLSNSIIVSANVIDRSIYLVLLLILAVIIVLTHASGRLKISRKSV